MRVIAGKFKGKRLLCPDGNRVRPTSDRIKEAVFSALYSMGKLEGARFLDLFSGTGALGIEALSRGARECVFTDIDKESVLFTKKNIGFAGVKNGASVYRADYNTALETLGGKEKFDVILIDPPYRSRYEHDILSLISKLSVLAKGGVIVLEHDRDNEIHDPDGRFDIDTRVYSNTKISFIRENRVKGLSP
jgi:16S rRNA (guanine(966)-N(2))-methyltransferase RsmD